MTQLLEPTTEDARLPEPPNGETPRWTGDGFRRGVVAGIPVAIGVAAYGTVFGVLARQVGLTFLEVVLMNVIVLAGAAQTAALDLWTYPLPIFAIVVTTLLINLRLLLLGAALRPWLGGAPGRRVYPLMHIVTDEGWALAMNRHARGERDVGFLVGALAIVVAGWVPATAIGFVVGTQIVDPAAIGLDFAFPAIFGAMLIGTWRGRFDLVPWVTSGVTAWLAYQWLPGTWYIIAGALAGIAVVAVTVDKVATLESTEPPE